MKKHNPTTPHLVNVADQHGDVLIDPSERARLRAVTVQHEQRQARARREALQIIAAAERLTETPAPAPAPTPPDLRNLEIWTSEGPPFGRIAAMIFMAMAAFIAGLAVGRL